MTPTSSITHPLPGHPGLTGAAIYLDYNAATPIDPHVADTMRPALGRGLRQPLQRPCLRPARPAAPDRARAQVAALLGAGDPTARGHRTVPDQRGADDRIAAIVCPGVAQAS